MNRRRHSVETASGLRTEKILGLLSVLLVCGLYSPTLGRGFVSEDFLILRRFFEARQEGRFFELAWTHATGPWLEITLVSFFRPLSSFILQCEEALFGTSSRAYGWAHLCIHLGNAGLLYCWARTLYAHLDSDKPQRTGQKHDLGPLAVALLFAVYPLHPNTVVFIASFATLWCCTFMLGALCLYAMNRFGAAFLASTAALASYEQAVILPGCFIAFDLLMSRNNDRERRTGMVLRWVAATFLVASYLGLRRVFLGRTIGGYDDFRRRLADPEALFESLLRNLGRLFYPNFAPSSLNMAIAWIGLGISALFFVLWLWQKHSDVRLGLLGLALVLGSQAPFSFVGVVPGNARYWYFASCGSALFLAASWQSFCGVLPLRPHGRKRLWTMGWVLMVGTYGLLLWQTSKLHVVAAQNAEQIQNALLDLESADDPIFVAGTPAFLKYQRVNTAQILHWGLADTVLPPFVSESNTLRHVYPVPNIKAELMAPLSRISGHVFRWQDHRLVPEHLSESDAQELDLSALSDDAFPVVGRVPAHLRSATVYVAARGHYWTQALKPGDPVELPQSWLTSMGTLYDWAPVYWWLEGRGEDDAQQFSKAYLLKAEVYGRSGGS